MSQASGPGPVSIAPPKPVVASAVLVCLEALGLVVLTVVILVSGFRPFPRPSASLLAQAAYYLVLAAAMVVCGLALLTGRRWGRTPTIVVQIVVVAIGYWLAVPSGRLVWGIVLIALGVVTGGLLVTRPANEWISRFPSLFGPEPGR